MIELDTVLLKVVSRCNINCTYCYVYNMGDAGWQTMPTQMSPETVSAVGIALAKLALLQRRRFGVVLHGGEPLLLGRLGLERVLGTIRRALSSDYPISIQTNGSLITNEILDVCAKHRTSLSVSIDGPEKVHDRWRVAHDGSPTHASVLKGIRLLREHPASEFLFAGALAVIDPESDPVEVYQFFKEQRSPSVDFLYCDGNHSRLPRGKSSFESTEYGQWLSKLLDAYLSDPMPIRVRLLDDLMRIILGGSGSKEGLGITDYGILIIETDGSISKNDTLKSSFNGADRFVQTWTVHDHEIADVLKSREFEVYHASQRATAAVCRSCPELRACGGGMRLHRWSDETGYDNPSVYCADQMLLIRRIREHLVRNGVPS